MNYTITLNQDELKALIACVEYIMDNEQTHYEECLEEMGESTYPEHIYYMAQALSHIKHLKWTGEA